MLTTKAPVERIAGNDSVRRSTQTMQSGGSSESEQNALAVNPRGRPSSPRLVITVTPLANEPIKRKKRARSTGTLGLPNVVVRSRVRPDCQQCIAWERVLPGHRSSTLPAMTILATVATEGDAMDMDRDRFLVSTEWLAEHLDDPKVRVVDCRYYFDGRVGRDEYDKGHLPGAVYLDWSNELSTKDDPIAFKVARGPQVKAVMEGIGVGDETLIVGY